MESTIMYIIGIQLALPLSQLPQKATIFAMKSVTYIQMNEWTPTIMHTC